MFNSIKKETTMIDIRSYLHDGANWQAQAILAYLRMKVTCMMEELPYQLNLNRRLYDIEVKCGRYENCREQGYVITVFVGLTQLKNFAFYEHRSTDRIGILTSDAWTINTPTIDEMYGDRNGSSADIYFPEGEIMKAGEYIMEEIKTAIVKHVIAHPECKKKEEE